MAFIDEVRGYEELKKLSKDRRRKRLAPKEILVAEGTFPATSILLKVGN